jgi:hypothetical protein
MEAEFGHPVDEAEYTDTAMAQPLVSSTSMPDSVADTIETSPPTAHSQRHIIPAQHHSDSSMAHWAEELTDREALVRIAEPEVPPVIPHDAHKPTTADAILLHSVYTDPMIAGQSHTQVPPQEAVEADYEVHDEAHYDNDSAYDGDSIRNDDTETLASFITNYRWENGRRYHAYSDGAYWV